MENEEVTPNYKIWKEREEAQKLARKIFRRKVRFFAFIPGFIWGVVIDFSSSGNSILGILVGPFIIGVVFSLLSTFLLMGLGM